MVIAKLDFSSVVCKLSKLSHKRGPKGHEILPLLNSLIAMQLEKIKTIHGLVQRLNSDPTLRYNCGFDVLKPAPSESTFSRFLDKLSSSPELEEEFKALVLKAKSLGIIDGTEVAIVEQS